MPKLAKKAKRQYIEVGYRDKIVFTSRRRGVAKLQTKSRTNIVDTWQKSQGLWTDHPVFHSMSTKEIMEWLRGEDADA